MGCGTSKAVDTEISNTPTPPEVPGIDAPSEGVTGGLDPNDPATAKTIHSTIRWNKIADVGVMVDSKELANVLDKRNDNSPLHIAAQNGHLALVQMLLKKGADVNAQNAQGQTAMHMAVSYDLDPVVACLTAAGADGELTNKHGFAAKFGLEGEKDPTSVNHHLQAFKDATTENELLAVLDVLLQNANDGKLDKQTFPGLGLSVKKKNAAAGGGWTNAVQAKFVMVVQSEGMK